MVLQDFFNNNNQEKDDFGCAIIRTNVTSRQSGLRISDQHKIIEYIQQTYGEHVRIRCFDSRKETENILNLSKELEDKPLIPTIIFIVGALRAGKTLDTTQHIKSWIEMSNGPDTTAQSVGRCFGYPEENKRSRSADTFPIYCNKKVLEKVVKYYDDLKTLEIPEGTWTKGTGDKPNRKKERICALEFYKTEKEARDTYIGSPFLNTISKAYKNDYAGDLISAPSRWFRQSGKDQRLFFVDGPNEKHRESYKKLIEKYPQVKEKPYIKIVETKIKDKSKTSISIENNLKKQSMFHDK